MATIDINKLKSMGMMANPYMWHCSIPSIPLIGANDLEFLVRTTGIPGKDMGVDIVRFLGKQYSLPAAISNSSQSTWSFTLLTPETHETLDQLVRWFYSIPKNAFQKNVDSIKTDVYITLMGLDKDNIVKKFKIMGIFPLDIPSISDLGQSKTSGHIEMNFKMSFDDVDWDYENKLDF